MIKCIAPIFG